MLLSFHYHTILPYKDKGRHKIFDGIKLQKQGKNTDRKRSKDIAALKDPNFDIFCFPGLTWVSTPDDGCVFELIRWTKNGRGVSKSVSVWIHPFFTSQLSRLKLCKCPLVLCIERSKKVIIMPQ